MKSAPKDDKAARDLGRGCVVIENPLLCEPAAPLRFTVSRRSSHLTSKYQNGTFTNQQVVAWWFIPIFYIQSMSTSWKTTIVVVLAYSLFSSKHHLAELYQEAVPAWALCVGTHPHVSVYTPKNEKLLRCLNQTHTNTHTHILIFPLCPIVFVLEWFSFSVLVFIAKEHTEWPILLHKIWAPVNHNINSWHWSLLAKWKMSRVYSNRADKHALLWLDGISERTKRG